MIAPHRRCELSGFHLKGASCCPEDGGAPKKDARPKEMKCRAFEVGEERTHIRRRSGLGQVTAASQRGALRDIGQTPESTWDST